MTRIKQLFKSRLEAKLNAIKQKKQKRINRKKGNLKLTYNKPKQTEIDSLREAVIKLSEMLQEKGLSEDDIVADFQELRNKNQ